MRVCKASGRPLPKFSDDDFLDYCVTEAIVAKYAQEEDKAQKRQAREEWKRRPVGSGM